MCLVFLSEVFVRSLRSAQLRSTLRTKESDTTWLSTGYQQKPEQEDKNGFLVKSS